MLRYINFEIYNHVFTFRSYALCSTLAYIVFIVVFYRLNKQYLKIDIFFILLLAIISRIGSKLFFIAEALLKGNYQTFSYFWFHDGILFYGGLITGSIFIYIYLLAKKIDQLDVRKIFDNIGLALPIPFIIGKIGCFFNGCCFGMQTSLFCGVTLPRQQFPIHPVPIYDIIAMLVIFLLILKYKDVNKKGSLFFLFILLYASYRLLIEIIRTNYKFFHLFSFSQAISIILIFIALHAIKEMAQRE